MRLPTGLPAALGRIVRDTLGAALREPNNGTRRLLPQRGPSQTASGPTPDASRGPGTGVATGYPGDYPVLPRISYAPHPGPLADPGEIVWTWVPYEEDHTRGKDRPVLIVGRDGDWLLALQLTSQDHDLDARQEASEGRYWVDIGTGAWDAQGRPSEVRVNRVIRVDPDAVRRVATHLPKDRFVEVAAGMRRHLPSTARERPRQGPLPRSAG